MILGLIIKIFGSFALLLLNGAECPLSLFPSLEADDLFTASFCSTPYVRSFILCTRKRKDRKPPTLVIRGTDQWGWTWP